MPPVPTYSKIVVIRRRILDANAKNGSINPKDVIYMEKHLPGHYYEMLINHDELHTKIRTLLNRNPKTIDYGLVADAIAAEKQLELTQGLPSGPESPQKTKAKTRTPNSTNRQQGQQSTEDGENTDLDPNQPSRKKPRMSTIMDVDMSGHENLRNFFAKPKDEFKPQMPSDTEVPIGFWEPDPEPQRLVTAQIQVWGELGFFVRNLTREGKGIKPSTEHMTDSDSLLDHDFDEIQTMVDWHQNCLDAEANISESALLHYVFTNVGDQEKLRPWGSGEDVSNMKELGQVYEWLTREMRSPATANLFGLGDTILIDNVFMRVVGLTAQIRRASSDVTTRMTECLETLATIPTRKESGQALWDVFKDLVPMVNRSPVWLLDQRVSPGDKVEIDTGMAEELDEGIANQFRCSVEKGDSGIYFLLYRGVDQSDSSSENASVNGKNQLTEDRTVSPDVTTGNTD